MRAETKKHGFSVFKIITAVILGVYIICLIAPFIWGIITTFKEQLDFRYNKFGMPKEWTIDNYTTVYQSFVYEYVNTTNPLLSKTFGFGGMLLNSFLYSFTVAFVGTLTIYVVAYARNVYEFKFLKILDYIVLFAMIVPIVGALPSEILIMKKLGLYESFFGMTVIAKMSFLGMYYFVVGTVIRSVPKAFAEAAEIDGASEAQVLLKIFFPLTASAFLTIFIIKFVESWNDYQTPYIYLKNYPTLALGLYNAKNAGNSGIETVGEKIAASLLVAVPSLVLFSIFSKKFMGAISLGEGIKE
mgnify:CR=1 FL=1